MNVLKIVSFLFLFCFSAMVSANSLQAPTPSCMDKYDEKEECLNGCCGWCGSTEMCLNGNAAGPSKDNWGRTCSDLQTWNFTGQGCLIWPKWTGWAISGGLLALPVVVFVSYKLCNYYNAKGNSLIVNEFPGYGSL